MCVCSLEPRAPYPLIPTHSLLDWSLRQGGEEDGGASDVPRRCLGRVSEESRKSLTNVPEARDGFSEVSRGILAGGGACPPATSSTPADHATDVSWPCPGGAAGLAVAVKRACSRRQRLEAVGVDQEAAQRARALLVPHPRPLREARGGLGRPQRPHGLSLLPKRRSRSEEMLARRAGGSERLAAVA